MSARKVSKVIEISDDDLQTMQGHAHDLITTLRHAIVDLECAESCETTTDFRANLVEADGWLEAARKELRELRCAATGGKVSP